MIGQSLSNRNETCYSVQIIKIYSLNEAQEGKGHAVWLVWIGQPRSPTYLMLCIFQLIFFQLK